MPLTYLQLPFYPLSLACLFLVFSCSENAVAAPKKAHEHYWALEKAFAVAWDRVDALSTHNPILATQQLGEVKQAMHALLVQNKSLVDESTHRCLKKAFEQRNMGISEFERALSHGVDASLEMAQAYKQRRKAEEAVLKCLPTQ